MFKLTFNILTTIFLSIGLSAQAMAWEQHALSTSHTGSSTPHYGGNNAPLVLSSSHIQVATPNASGIAVWNSINDGITWSSETLSTNKQFTNTYLASINTALGWGETQQPTMFHRNISFGSWSAASAVWPLANWNIMDVSTSTAGDIIVLVTTPSHHKLVEGQLFILYGNAQGWSRAIPVSSQHSLVGDAKIVAHPSGLLSIAWSQRNQNTWQILTRYSYDQATWSSPLTIVESIAAPYFQEAGVQIAADALNENEVALAYTGWSMKAHSQLWSKAFDVLSGITTQAAALLPDAGYMVHQPSLVTLAKDTWAVAWQQTIGVDSEIFVAQHQAGGTWTNAVNVSMDPMHMDRDPHVALGSSKTLNIAFTRRIQADIQEVYIFTEGDINDSSLDTDGDGIPNSQEQGFDLDHDGIDDAHSARIATWMAKDGRYALIVQGSGELRRVQAPSLKNANIEQPSFYETSSNLFSFQIHALSQGETTQIHVVTPHRLTADTTWLKLNPNAQWSDSEKNTVFLDNTGTGLIIYLTDGGTGDEDGIADGIIIDPAVLATPKVDSSNTSTDNTNVQISQAEKPCLAPTSQNPWGLLMLSIILAGITLNKRSSLLSDEKK
ncbi:MAG TPA: hypothetical protein EYG66_03585 [Mariprofundaceae bacterium]|nr:hypothetical protein [Mariprofundaceae bacterium]